MMKVLTVNEGYSDNLGDQAIQYCLRKLLEEKNIDVYFQDYSGNVNSSVNDYTYQSEKKLLNRLRGMLFSIIPPTFKVILRKNLWLVNNCGRIKSALKENDYDYVIFGGGQMLQSNGIFPMMIKYWTKSVKKYSRAKIIFFGVGIGSNLEKKDLENIRESLLISNEIYVRDDYSKKIAEGIVGKKIEYVPDVVFALRRFLNPNVTKEKVVLIGIPVESQLKKFDSYKSMCDVYDWYIKNIEMYAKKGYRIRYTYTTVSDYQEILKFNAYMKEKNIGIEVEFSTHSNLEEMVNEINKAEIIISGRMHSLIIGYVYKCKLIPFIFSQKIESFYYEYVKNQRDISVLEDEIRKSLTNALRN